MAPILNGVTSIVNVHGLVFRIVFALLKLKERMLHSSFLLFRAFKKNFYKWQQNNKEIENKIAIVVVNNVKL